MTSNLYIEIWLMKNNKNYNLLFSKKELIAYNQPCFFVVHFYRLNINLEFIDSKRYSLRYSNDGKPIITRINYNDSTNLNDYVLNDYEKTLLLMKSV